MDEVTADKVLASRKSQTSRGAGSAKKRGAGKNALYTSAVQRQDRQRKGLDPDDTKALLQKEAARALQNMNAAMNKKSLEASKVSSQKIAEEQREVQRAHDDRQHAVKVEIASRVGKSSPGKSGALGSTKSSHGKKAFSRSVIQKKTKKAFK
jgi:hypothetical protein